MRCRSLTKLTLALATALLAAASPASATTSCTLGATTVCFAEDILADPGFASVPASSPNSSAAEMEFQLLIGAGNFETESFESFTDGDHGPLNIFQGGALSVTGVLSDTVDSGGTVRMAPLDDAINRGFPISSTNFWKNETVDTTSPELFRVTFSEEVRSFGFYATAWGTQSTTGATALVLDLIPMVGAPITLVIPHSPDGNLAGSSFYYGVIADAPFIAAALRNSTDIDGGDRIGFDEFTVAVVPEPSTALLLSAGLLGIAAIGRRRSA